MLYLELPHGINHDFLVPATTGTIVSNLLDGAIISISSSSEVVLSSLVSTQYGSLIPYVIATVNSGATLTSSTYGIPALSSGTGWPIGAILILNNYGTIQGKPGIGSSSIGSSSNYCLNYMSLYSNGTRAIDLSLLATINNYGSIYGGGGGGGSATVYGYSNGGAGGDAIVSNKNIIVNNNGNIYGGGGGGGGCENGGGSSTEYYSGTNANTYLGGVGGYWYTTPGGSGGGPGADGSDGPQFARDYNCGHGAGSGGLAGKAINSSGSVSVGGNLSTILGGY